MRYWVKVLHCWTLLAILPLEFSIWTPWRINGSIFNICKPPQIAYKNSWGLCKLLWAFRGKHWVINSSQIILFEYYWWINDMDIGYWLIQSIISAGWCKAKHSDTTILRMPHNCSQELHSTQPSTSVVFIFVTKLQTASTLIRLHWQLNISNCQKGTRARDGISWTSCICSGVGLQFLNVRILICCYQDLSHSINIMVSNAHSLKEILRFAPYIYPVLNEFVFC